MASRSFFFFFYLLMMLIDVTQRQIAHTPWTQPLFLAVVLGFVLGPSYPTLFIVGALQVLQALFALPRGTTHWGTCSSLNVLLLSWYGFHFVRGRKLTLNELWSDALPAMRWLLIVMYFWAALAKCNWDYFDPTVSCVPFFHRWIGLPEIPERFVPFFAAISVLIEFAIPVALLFPRLRVLGVLVGFLFHFPLGFVITDASTLVYAFYFLFLPESCLAKVLGFWRGRPRNLRVILSLLFFSPFLATYVVEYGMKRHSPFLLHLDTLVWAHFVVFTAGVVAFFLYRSDPDNEKKLKISILSCTVILATCLNGLCPYLGVKSRHGFAMYSNLRTEGENPNHLFIPVKALRVFPYLDRPVRIVSSSVPLLQQHANAHEFIPFFRIKQLVQERMEVGERDLSVIYDENGKEVSVFHAEEDPELGQPISWLERKIVNLRPLSGLEKQGCYW